MIDVKKFMRDGWCVVDIADPIPSVEGSFKDKLSELSKGKLNTISDDIFKEVHIGLSEIMWKEEWSLLFAKSLLPFVAQLIGWDLMVQYYPYFRMARPNKPQDNIGYHKDTQYGQTPYELAVHIPFVDLDEKSALRVISGSHLMQESVFTIMELEEDNIERGSIENKTGRPYAPRRLSVPNGMQTTPLCVKVGQAVLFSPALFHGQEVNEGDATRISCDLRFVSSLHRDRIRIGKVHAGYVEVSKNLVEQLAEQYYGAQK